MAGTRRRAGKCACLFCGTINPAEARQLVSFYITLETTFRPSLFLSVDFSAVAAAILFFLWPEWTDGFFEDSLKTTAGSPLPFRFSIRESSEWPRSVILVSPLLVVC